MAAPRFCADTHDGYHLDNPSPVALLVLVRELNEVDNTYVKVWPNPKNPVWQATVSLLEDEIYEIEYRDTRVRERRTVSHRDSRAVVYDLLGWLSRRIPLRRAERGRTAPSAR